MLHCAVSLHLNNNSYGPATSAILVSSSGKLCVYKIRASIHSCNVQWGLEGRRGGGGSPQPGKLIQYSLLGATQLTRISEPEGRWDRTQCGYYEWKKCMCRSPVRFGLLNQLEANCHSRGLQGAAQYTSVPLPTAAKVTLCEDNTRSVAQITVI